MGVVMLALTALSSSGFVRRRQSGSRKTTPKLILGTEKYLNDQIQKDDEYKHLCKIGYFVDPPAVHRSDEIIDLTCLEDDHDDDLDDEDD